MTVVPVVKPCKEFSFHEISKLLVLILSMRLKDKVEGSEFGSQTNFLV